MIYERNVRLFYKRKKVFTTFLKSSQLRLMLPPQLPEVLYCGGGGVCGKQREKTRSVASAAAAAAVVT